MSACLYYAFKLFYKKIKLVRDSPFRFGRTIFVSNHPGSFMDPLIISSTRKPILFFMTRADVFNKFTRPIFWAAHMLPIFRQRDGVDTKINNAQIFRKTNVILSKKRNILIFGEGYTEDNLQRRLQPLKKGPMRIGFTALEYDNWKHKIYVQGLGINYTDFNLRRSEVLIASSEAICLNDYQHNYEENPSKTINELTKLLETNMQGTITDVRDVSLTDFHENIMMLARKGLHPTCHNNDSIENRLDYSKRLAHWMNSLTEDEKAKYMSFKVKLEEYQELLSKAGISENERYKQETKSWQLLSKSIQLFLLLPFFILGFIHAGLPYLWIKNWVEKKFKRPVYWGSTKMIAAIFIVPILNLPILFILPNYLCYDVYWNWVFTIVYYLLIGVFAYLGLLFRDIVIEMIRYFRVQKIEISKLNKEHASLMKEINEINEKI